MAGSKKDLVNVKVDSVLTPERQRELEALTDALAVFEPTVIFTERVASSPDYIDPAFSRFTDATLTENANERAQVAYRLAKRANVTRVHGIDEVPSDGEPDYFPFQRLQAHAQQTGQKEALAAEITRIQKLVSAFTDKSRAHSIPRRLLASQTLLASPDFYYRLAAFDVGEAQPAAELQAFWFMRNAKIWSKLRDVVKPGDRAVVVFGAGHKFWLEHMARHSPGFVLVDPVPYLKAATETVERAPAAAVERPMRPGPPVVR